MAAFGPCILDGTIFRASMSVFGGPLNRFEPDLPRSSDFDNTFMSITKGALVPIMGNIIGQNGTESQLRTIRVPQAAVFRECLMVLENR